MMFRRLTLLALVLCSAFCGMATAREKETSAVEAMSARIDQLEAEITALRRQPDLYQGGGGEGCACASDCGCAQSCCCENSCWCAPGCTCGFYGGAEVAWLRPRWRAFDAFTVQDSTGVPTTLTTSSFDYDYDPTAKFFVGYTGCNGLGVRASWWEFDHDPDSVRFTLPDNAAGFVRVFGPLGVDINNFGAGPGSTFVATQSLELQTIDIEATSCFQACGGDVVAAFGVRYAKYDVTTTEAAFDPAGALLGAADQRETFEGWGPTVAMEYVRPLCFSGFSLFAGLRGSLLFGDENQTARRFDGTGTLVTVATRDANEPLAIADLQIALQWCHCGWFARGGWQAQYWDDLAADIGPAGFQNRGIEDSNLRSDLGLQGFFFSAGAIY